MSAPTFHEFKVPWTDETSSSSPATSEKPDTSFPSDVMARQVATDLLAAGLITRSMYDYLTREIDR